MQRFFFDSVALVRSSVVGAASWAGISSAKPCHPWVRCQKTDKGAFEIVRVSKGGPAEASGLKEKDEILEVNGDAVADWSERQFRTRTSGDVGSKMVFTIRRESDLVSISVTLLPIFDLLMFEVVEGKNLCDTRAEKGTAMICQCEVHDDVESTASESLANPSWNFSRKIRLRCSDDLITFRVSDFNKSPEAGLVGRVTIHADDIDDRTGSVFDDRWHRLEGRHGDKEVRQIRLRLMRARDPSGLAAVSESRIARIPKAGRYFRAPLSGQTDGEGKPIMLIWLCGRIIQLGGLHTEGLFRVSPSSAALEEYVAKLEEQGPGVESEGASEDVHVVAAAVKKWLRELLHPLIPDTEFRRAVELGGTEGGEDATRAAWDLVQSLDQKDSIVALQFLCREFLPRLFAPDAISHTKMSPANLGVIFAPSILRCPDEQFMTSHTAMAAFVAHLLSPAKTSLTPT